MRKFISALLMASLVMGSLVGCGKGDKETSQTGDKALKVSMIVSGNLGDKSFYDSAYAGLQRAEKDLGIKLKVIELNGDPSKQEPTVLDESEGGADIIVVPAHGVTEHVLKHASEFPDTKYISFDVAATTEFKEPNMYGIAFKQNEGSFLAGALGAKLSKTGVIGFVGGMENPILNDFLIGYINGAKTANPDIKIAVSFVGNFADSAKGKELALTQINNQKVDVVHQVAGQAGLGVIDAGKEKGIKVLGVDSDQALLFKDTDPEKANAIVTSALKNLGDVIYSVIEKEMNGQLTWGCIEEYGVKEGASGIAKNDIYEASVDDETKKYIDELEEKIKSGELTVPSAFTMPNDEFMELKNSVKP